MLCYYVIVHVIGNMKQKQRFISLQVAKESGRSAQTVSRVIKNGEEITPDQWGSSILSNPLHQPETDVYYLRPTTIQQDLHQLDHVAVQTFLQIREAEQRGKLNTSREVISLHPEFVVSEST